ncbi:MAG: hypothetical protein ABIH00_00005 [Armatimonadota bacterium]
MNITSYTSSINRTGKNTPKIFFVMGNSPTYDQKINGLIGKFNLFSSYLSKKVSSTVNSLKTVQKTLLEAQSELKIYENNTNLFDVGNEETRIRSLRKEVTILKKQRSKLITQLKKDFFEYYRSEDDKDNKNFIQKKFSAKWKALDQLKNKLNSF